MKEKMHKKPLFQTVSQHDHLHQQEAGAGLLPLLLLAVLAAADPRDDLLLRLDHRHHLQETQLPVHAGSLHRWDVSLCRWQIFKIKLLNEEYLYKLCSRCSQ